ncbi:MAG: ribonuclease HI family protein [Promethearchaeota archaeon]
MEKYKLFVDGASRGNPGPAAYAFMLLGDKEEILKQGYGYIGNQTNNIAEYTAIINGLKVAKKLTNGTLRVYSDSTLVVKQMNGQYEVKAEHIFKLHTKVKKLVQNFKRVEFTHVKRNHEFIEKCDFLCNKCLDNMNLK